MPKHNQIPSKLIICGKQYRVMRKDLGCEENIIHYGSTNHPQQKIEVSSKTKIEQQKETLLHEIIHVISEGYQIGLRERQIKTLANGLYDTMKRNRYRVW